MKKLLVLMLAIALFASFTTQETPKKVFIQSIENKIEIGALAKNRNLVFGFKNILLENLQELNYDVTDSANDADYSIKVELLYFDVLETNSGFSVFHKSDNETVLRVKGYLYNKDGKKIKEFVSVGKSSEISMSTLIISEGGGINQTSVSNVIKKSSETLILNLFTK
jgi:thioredoxin-related protein